MSNFAFVPAEPVWTAGRQFTMRVVNEDEVDHNFSVPSVPIDLDFKAGDVKTVIFVIPATGPVEFFCKFHRDRGMQGSIKVQTAGSVAPTTGVTPSS